MMTGATPYNALPQLDGNADDELLNPSSVTNASSSSCGPRRRQTPAPAQTYPSTLSAFRIPQVDGDDARDFYYAPQMQHYQQQQQPYLQYRTHLQQSQQLQQARQHQVDHQPQTNVEEQNVHQQNLQRQSTSNENEELNSDLDDGEDVNDEGEQGIENTILCQYEKVSRVKDRWRCTFKDGVMILNGKEYLFARVSEN